MKPHPESPLTYPERRFKSRLHVCASRATALALTCTLITALHAATTIVVTNTSDTGPDAPAAGSLRAALAAAADGDTIDATGIAGTITLMPGATSSAELTVATSVTILGPGPTNLTVDANRLSRVFHITPDHTVTLQGLSIVNGLATGAFPADVGGGILNDHSALTVDRCILRGNSAVEGTFEGTGGGIFNNGLNSGSAMLTVIDSLIVDNIAGDSGGVANVASVSGSATVIVKQSTLSGNSAANAGCIGNYTSSGKASAVIIASTLSGNSAKFEGGAGINNGSSPGLATMDLVNSTVSGNAVLGEFSDGAGLLNLNDAGHLAISSCTFSGNSLSDPTRHGGAIYNSSGTVEIGNSILRAGALGENLYTYSSAFGTVISRGFNLSSDNGGGLLTSNGDQINTDPKLGPLADNGGPTFTHLPLAGSPAVDQGARDVIPDLASDTDQRGLARTVDDPAIVNAVLGDGTDIGAVEIQAAPPPPPPQPVADVAITFLGADKTSVKQGEVLTYTIAIRNFGPNTAANVVVKDLMASGTGFLSARATKGNFSAPAVNETGAVAWSVGDMANGTAEGAELVVTVLVKGKTTVTNLANISSDADDPNAANNIASITTAVATGGSSGGGKKK